MFSCGRFQAVDIIYGHPTFKEIRDNKQFHYLPLGVSKNIYARVAQSCLKFMRVLRVMLRVFVCATLLRWIVALTFDCLHRNKSRGNWGILI